jgi:hypothetical protein
MMANTTERCIKCDDIKVNDKWGGWGKRHKLTYLHTVCPKCKIITVKHETKRRLSGI